MYIHRMNTGDFASEVGAVLDHIGIAVRGFTSASALFRILGLEVLATETVAEQGVEVAVIPAGGTRLELLRPLDDSSSIAGFLDRRGEGLHHIALRVENIRSALNRCRDAGIELIDDTPRRGVGGSWIAFLHPRSTGGILIELVQYDSARQEERR